MSEQPRVWVYFGSVTDIHDGDTLTVDLDMGCFLWRKKIPVRFNGINAPELATQAGKDALTFLQTLVKVGDTVRLESVDGKFFEKYGRLLARLYTTDAGGIEFSVNDLMVASGHAVVYNP